MYDATAVAAVGAAAVVSLVFFTFLLLKKNNYSGRCSGRRRTDYVCVCVCIYTRRQLGDDVPVIF